jgi:two-component system, LuxR family, response regulator FixJ
MNERQTIHFVEQDFRLRADLARATLAIGHHAEVYADLAELVERPPRSGVVAVHDAAHTPEGPDEGGVGGGQIADQSDCVSQTLDYLAAQGIWLPLVAMDENPTTGRVVSAIKAGALDYLSLPVVPARLAAMLERIGDEARAHAEARRRMIEARSRIGNLSVREREVLDWLTRGSSNKSIARELAISPRTVEIHRANMMSKLGANSTGDAVRIGVRAGLDEVGNTAELLAA